MQRELVRNLLREGKPSQTVTVAGWIRTRRDAKGGFSFLEVNDGSCLANLQVVAAESLPNYQQEVIHLHPGASVVVRGELVASPGKEQAVELRAAEVKVLGHSDPTAYPLGKQRISFERLRELPHLRPRTNSFGAIARMRNLLAIATHEFFQARDFLYVHTPIITASNCEGAGEMFRVTTLDLANPPRTDRGLIDEQADFFGRRTGLTVSGQL